MKSNPVPSNNNIAFLKQIIYVMLKFKFEIILKLGFPFKKAFFAIRNIDFNINSSGQNRTEQFQCPE